MQAVIRRLLRTETNNSVSFSVPEPSKAGSPSRSSLRSLISSKSFASIRSSWSFSDSNDDAKPDKNDLAFTVRTPSTAWTYEQVETLVGFMVSVPALSECSKVAVEKLARSVHGSLYNRHAQIWRVDSPADFVYIVVYGSVRVADEYAADGANEDGGSAMGGESEDGVAKVHTQELYVVEPRALLGVEEVHACCRRVAQAEAVEEGTLLLRIPAGTYLRSVGSATSFQFTTKVDFLSGPGLFGCMGREAILKLAPCFTYGIVQAGTVLARQGEHCDKLILIDSGTCTLLFDPTLAARGQALPPTSQQPGGLSPARPDRLGAAPSHLCGHTQSFTGGCNSQDNKAEADLRASEALLTLGPGSLVGDACVLLGQAQMVVSAVATTDVALYAVVGGAFERRVGAEARQGLHMLATARAAMLAQLTADMAARHTAINSDAHTAGLRSRVLHGKDLRQLDLLSAAQARGSRQAGAVTPDPEADSAVDVTALSSSAHSGHLKAAEHGRGKTSASTAAPGSKHAAHSSMLGLRLVQSQPLTQLGGHVTNHSENHIPVGGSSGGHYGSGVSALAGISSSCGQGAVLPSVQVGKAASAFHLLDRLEAAAPLGAHTLHLHSPLGSTTHAYHTSHTPASGLGCPGATAASNTGGIKAGTMLPNLTSSGPAGLGSTGAAAAAELSPLGRASSLRALISPTQAHRTTCSLSSTGGQRSASSAYSLPLTVMLPGDAGVAPLMRRRSSLGMTPATLHASPPQSPWGGSVLKEGGEDLSPHADLHMDLQHSYSPQGRRSLSSLSIHSQSSGQTQSAAMQALQSLRFSGAGATSPTGFRRRNVEHPAVISAVAPGRHTRGSETGLTPSHVPFRSSMRLRSETGISHCASSANPCHALDKRSSAAVGNHSTAHGRRSFDSHVLSKKPMVYTSISPSASSSNLIRLPTLLGDHRRSSGSQHQLFGVHPRQGSVTSLDSHSQSHDEASFFQQHRARKGGVMDMLMMSSVIQAPISQTTITHANRAADDTAMCHALDVTLNVADGLGPQLEQQQKEQLTHGSAAQEPDGFLFMSCAQAAPRGAQRDACMEDAVQHQSHDPEAHMWFMLEPVRVWEQEATSQFVDLRVELPPARQSPRLVNPASRHLLLDQVGSQASSASKLEFADGASPIAARQQQQARNTAEPEYQVDVHSVSPYSSTIHRLEPDDELGEQYGGSDSERLSTGSKLSPAALQPQPLARPVGEGTSYTSDAPPEAVISSDGAQGHAHGPHTHPGSLSPAPPAHAPPSPTCPRQARTPSARPKIMRGATFVDLEATARGVTGAVRRPPSQLATPSCLAALVAGPSVPPQSRMSPVAGDSPASLQGWARPDIASNHSSGAVSNNANSTGGSSGDVGGIGAGADVGVGPRSRPPGPAASFCAALSMLQRPGTANALCYSPLRVSFAGADNDAPGTVTSRSNINSQAQPGHNHNHSNDVDCTSGNAKQQAAVAAPGSNSWTHSQSGIASALGDGLASGAGPSSGLSQSVMSAAAASPFLRPYTALSHGSSLSILLPGMSAGGGWEALSNGSFQSGLLPLSAAAGGGASTAPGLCSMSTGGCALGLGGAAIVSATVVVPRAHATSSHCNSPSVSSSGRVGGGANGARKSSTVTGGVTVQHPSAALPTRNNTGTDTPEVFKRRLPSRHASFNVLSTEMCQAKLPGHVPGPVDLDAAVAATAAVQPDLNSAGGSGDGGGLLLCPRTASLCCSGHGATPLFPTLSYSCSGLVPLPVSVAAPRSGNAPVAYANAPSHAYQHTHMHAHVHAHVDGGGLQAGAVAQGVQSSLPAMLKRGNELYQVRR